MPNETIVAVFKTGAQADQAISALKAAGVRSSAIERHSKDGETRDRGESASRETAPQSTGFFFWDMMLGAQGSHQDRPTYERSVGRGETVVAVTVSAREAETVMAVLEDASPIELDEQAAEDDSEEEVSRERAPRAAKRDTGEGEQVIPLSEEELQVGKRRVKGGTTRVRRYVVETPVEEEVSLPDERVIVERRRPVDGGATGDAFTEKTIEVIRDLGGSGHRKGRPPERGSGGPQGSVRAHRDGQGHRPARPGRGRRGSQRDRPYPSLIG